ncbi:MAG TPA: hypothetical protein VFT95_04520 [Micromonosporaceae bacterium]|nr:hypothetical protein [Micromonosporaceae bacterium]
MPTGLWISIVGLVLVIVAITKGKILIGWRDLKINASELLESVSFRAAILVLGMLMTLGGGALAVWSEMDGRDPGGFFVKETTTAYAGPSQDGYPAVGGVPVNTRIDVICTAYGRPTRFGDRTVALWDYTERGWINDHYISTGTSAPIAPGCVGSISRPKQGTARPSTASGPWAIVAEEGRQVPVRSSPEATAGPVAFLAAGTFVRLQCTTAGGLVVPAPKAMGPGHSNDVWDRIVDPSGWVPDSFVATYSTRPVAPACP